MSVTILKDTFGVIYLSELAQRLEKLNRKAKKLKLPEIQTNVVGYSFGYKAGEMGWIPGRTHIQIVGGRPNLPGFEFVGTIEHAQAGNVLRLLPGQSVSEEYKTKKAMCDHCQKIRSRKDTYLVREQSTGKLLQVGHNCVSDFLPGITPQQLAATLEFLKVLRDESETEFGGSWKQPPVGMQLILELSASAIRQFGWVSKAMVMNNHDGLISTASRVVGHLRPPEGQKESWRTIEQVTLRVTEADQKEAAETMKWSKGKIGDRVEYLHNLGVVLSKPEIEIFGRDMGLAVSAVSAMQREKNRLNLFKKPEVKPSEWVGTIGVRGCFELKFLDCFVVSAGYSHDETLRIAKFEDANGNQFSWFTGKNVGMDFEVGQTYKVKATVKSHREYKGVKQTTINRVSKV